LDAGQVPPPATWRARLHAMLGSEDGGFEPYIKLWREAQILADRDPHIRDAYLLTMQMWHEETVTIIEQGKQAGEFTFTANATDIAWRLIALVCGLDGMYVLGIPEMADPAFKFHLDRMITLELFA
ncbi:TetR family transcriptional regulator, partial [Salmonella enterica subsp. enterica serovar Muenchen]|nr:TetR family transcriptional regulator [Salmonella enterica subsp. enterica serovar Muenchen]